MLRLLQEQPPPLQLYLLTCNSFYKMLMIIFYASSHLAQAATAATTALLPVTAWSRPATNLMTRQGNKTAALLCKVQQHLGFCPCQEASHSVWMPFSWCKPLSDCTAHIVRNKSWLKHLMPYLNLQTLLRHACFLSEFVDLQQLL